MKFSFGGHDDGRLLDAREKRQETPVRRVVLRPGNSDDCGTHKGALKNLAEEA